MSIDQQFSRINKVVNDVYSVIEKDDDVDEDAQQFSILRQAMIIWNRKVFKNFIKMINKGLKLEIKNYFQILHSDIKRNFNHSIPEEENADAEIIEKF